MIENFIALFDYDQRYLNGLCYWFAYMLKGRFPDGEIWYDQISNHFYIHPILLMYWVNQHDLLHHKHYY